MDEPRGVKGDWYASFGFMLCAVEPGTRIQLKRMTWEAAEDAQPLSVSPWLQKVDRTTKPTLPFDSVLGLPWAPYEGQKPYPGKFTKGIAGAVITQSCARLAREGGETSTPEFTQLVVVVKTAKQGADIKRAFIDYVADGDSYRLVINWQMIACGNVIEERDRGPKGDC